jgi:hypothetical protein
MPIFISIPLGIISAYIFLLLISVLSNLNTLLIKKILLINKQIGEKK